MKLDDDALLAAFTAGYNNGEKHFNGNKFLRQAYYTGKMFQHTGKQLYTVWGSTQNHVTYDTPKNQSDRYSKPGGRKTLCKHTSVNRVQHGGLNGDKTTQFKGFNDNVPGEWCGSCKRELVKRHL